MIRLARAAGLAAALAASSAFAGEIVERTPTLSARLDDGAALAAMSELRAFLEAENLALLEEMRQRSEEDREAATQGGFAFRPYSLDVELDARFVSDRYASILRKVRMDTGGAHPNLFLDPLTWDARARDFVRLDAFLGAGKQRRQGLAAISAALRAALSAREGMFPEAVERATVPDATVLKNFTLEPSTVSGLIGGLAFHFAPYEVAPYALGPQTVTIPADMLAPHLSAEVAPLFGGAPAR